MSDLFARGNNIGGSGAGGAGSYGSGAGGSGEFGKGAGGVGEYGSGAGGAGIFGSGAGGTGVGVNFDQPIDNRSYINSDCFLTTPDTLSEAVNHNSSKNNQTNQNLVSQYNQTTVKHDKTSYSVSSPIIYFLLNMLYPVIYIPLVLALISVGLNFVSWLIISISNTSNSLGMSLSLSIVWLIGMVGISIFHQRWIKRLKNPMQ